MISSIVTEYAGATFRSRLESRWAAFFDLAGWRWEYEPPEQGGWIPDFLLIGQSCVVKVEVKPIQWVGDENGVMHYAKTAPELEKVRNYVRRAEQDEDVLVLGAYPHCLCECIVRNDTTLLGVFLGAQFDGESIQRIYTDLAVLADGYAPHKLDFHAGYGSYAFRMGGQYDGDNHFLGDLSSEEVNTFWRKAGSTVQWRRS